MSDYSVEIEGMDELVSNLHKVNADIRGAVALKAVNAGAIQIQNRARINAPVRTGALRNSVSTISKQTGNGAEAEIGFRGLAYARIQEFGGTIYAKNKPYLVYRVNGQWRKSKSVTIKGKHYFERSINHASGDARDAMADVISSYLR